MTRTIAVVGCGLIGRAWTVVFARAGCDVRVWDPVAQVRDALPALLDETCRLSGDDPAALSHVSVFDTLEQARLDTACRGFLVHLEQVGILSPTQRELVIERLMALDGDEIDIEKLKWVVLMVLFSQPGQETAFSRMEDLVFDERSGALH